MSTHNQDQLIQELLNKDVEELYIWLGRELYGTPAFPPSPRQLSQLAHSWMEKKGDDLRALICNDKNVVQLCNAETDGYDPELVTAVADLIASLVIGVSPFTVSVLLIKVGLRRFCADIWEV
ncbi:MAG TPA: hypothetical protein VJ183_04660 [Chloroflexia bacterium]|nr:hypothetical protein [Chloroflexia bacterium]